MSLIQMILTLINVSMILNEIYKSEKFQSDMSHEQLLFLSEETI